MPDLKKVTAGEDFVVPASTWNAFIDATNDYIRRHLGRMGGQRQGLSLGANEIRLKNTGSSITTLEAFSAQAYGDPTIEVVDPPYDAQRDRLFDSAAISDVNAPFCITQEPIVGQAIGRAVSSGVAFCWVDVTDLDHTRAVPVVGETVLASAASGGVPILWRETALGEVLAAVLLDQPEALVMVTEIGGTVATSYNRETASIGQFDPGDYFVCVSATLTSVPANGGITIGVGLFQTETGSTGGILYLEQDHSILSGNKYALTICGSVTVGADYPWMRVVVKTDSLFAAPTVGYRSVSVKAIHKIAIP